MSVSDLPTLNALLNATSALFLIVGYIFIKQGRRDAHRNSMIGALAASALFLTSYLIYHYHIGSKPYEGEGVIRIIYFTILISHTFLAMAVVPLVGVAVWRAYKGEFSRHRAVARWTFPIWLYVSCTGVVIYLMLYVL